MSDNANADASLAELRAFIVDAWAARSPEERQAFAPDILADGVQIAAADAASPAPAPDPAPPVEWAPPEDLKLAPPVDPWQPPLSEGISKRSLPSSSGRLRTEPRRARKQESEEAPLPAAEIEAAAERAQLRAALSGAVAPKDLVKEESKRVQRETLTQILPRFDRTLISSKHNDWSWVLGASHRRAILGQLRQDSLDSALAAVENLPTDAPGSRLRAYARGERPSPASFRDMSAAELQTEVQALAWALPLDPALAPLLAAARRATDMARLLAGYDRLLADGVVGREKETQALRDFVTRLSSPRLERERFLILDVVGIGGAGKSTLLAHALRPLIAQALDAPDAPIIVQLDFDRRSFLVGGELEWSFEFTRQIGLFAQDLEQQLADLRARTLEERGRRGEDEKGADEAVESYHRSSSEFEWDVGDLVRPTGLGKRGLLLVLDTFEEWQRGAWRSWDKDAPARRVTEWVNRIDAALNIRTGLIVSGRAPLGHTSEGERVGSIELRDLNRTDAAALLRQLGVSWIPARSLARLVGGNPLVLKLAARHYRSLPWVSKITFIVSRQEALPEGTDEALRQGLLYRRFLDHIRDPDVRRLAHPGLALRQVTAELVQHVLALPCGLGDVTPSRADELFEKLEREVWLVERDGSALVHRPDVRRAMLHQMRGDPEQASRVRFVHEEAARWFAVQQPDLVEETYHRLALGERALLEDEEKMPPHDVLERLADAAGDFEPVIRALLRDLLGIKLSADELALLPEDRRRRSAEKRAADLVRRGQPAGALRYWRNGGYAATAESWYVQAVFQAPQWDAPVPFDEAASDGELAGGRLAYAYLLAFSRDDVEQREYEIALIDRLLQSQVNGSTRTGSVLEIVLTNIFFRQAAAAEHDSRFDVHGLPERFELAASRISATDIRRIATILPASAFPSRFDARRLLTQSFRPWYPWLSGFSERLRQAGGDETELSQLLRGIALQSRANQNSYTDEPTAGIEHLLGNYAESFAAAVMKALPGTPTAMELLDLLGWRGDDPEWRVPIRETLADVFASTYAFAPFAHRIGDLFDTEAVSADALISQHRRQPRGMWLNLVEFADRCGMLSALLAAAEPEEHPAVALVADAYRRWDEACDRVIAQRQGSGLSAA